MPYDNLKKGKHFLVRLNQSCFCSNTHIMQPNFIPKERDFKGSTKTPKAKAGLFEDADFPAANSSIGGVTGGTINVKIWRLMNQLLSPWVSIVGWARLKTLI